MSVKQTKALDELKKICRRGKYNKVFSSEDKENFENIVKDAKEFYPATVKEDLEFELLGGDKMTIGEMLELGLDEMTKTAFELALKEVNTLTEKAETLSDEATIEMDVKILIAKSPVLRAFV